MSKDELIDKLDKAFEPLDDDFEFTRLEAENRRLKQMIADSEAQNKRVLEKLELFVRSNQELEKTLENAIVPKFKKGQKVYYINSLNEISSGIIYNIRYDSAKGFDYFIPMLQIEDFRIKEEQLFETEEQAEAKLKELK